jgi:hypothetical protein
MGLSHQDNTTLIVYETSHVDKLCCVRNVEKDKFIPVKILLKKENTNFVDHSFKTHNEFRKVTFASTLQKFEALPNATADLYRISYSRYFFRPLSCPFSSIFGAESAAVFICR